MRWRWLLSIVFCGVWSPVWAEPLIVGYTLVSSRAVPGSSVDLIYTFSAVLLNDATPLRQVAATVRSMRAEVVVLDATVSFGDVDSGARVGSTDTFSIRKPRSLSLTAQDLRWTISGTPGAEIWSGFAAVPATGQAPLTVRFTPKPLSDAAVVSYRWDFDGDGVPDVSDPVGRVQSFSYRSPGTYNATLTIVDTLGRTSRRSMPVVVGNAPPDVSVVVSPTNGPTPLTVTLSATASDNEGIAAYEWDLDGDGSIDQTETTASGFDSVRRQYTAPGTYRPRLRVIDRLGVATVVSTPAMEIRAANPESPRVVLGLSATSGNAPLQVRMTASVGLSSGASVEGYDWDADGDGTFESTSVANTVDWLYGSAGTYYPRVRLKLADGRRAEDVKAISVSGEHELSLSTDTLDTLLGQSVTVNTRLTGVGRVGLRIERRNGGLVRTLLAPVQRGSGRYSDVWDGRDDQGRAVPEGVYLVVLTYEQDGVTRRLDLSTSTGGTTFNPPRTTLPSTFEPFNGRPLVVDFTLARAADVISFIGSRKIDVRYANFHSNQPLGRGTHRITWNGDNPSGQLIRLQPGDSFLIGIFAATLPDNAVFVRNGVQLTALAAGPPVCNPTTSEALAPFTPCQIWFELSQPADADIEVRDTSTGVVLSRRRVLSLQPGRNTVAWDGRADDGRYLAPGTYRIGITATQRNGFRSLTSFVLQRVYY